MTRLLNTDIHVGVAVDTDDGLIVPVLRNAQDLDLAGIDEQLTRLTAAARTRRIAPDMLRGATISLSNFGALGGLFATLVVVPPQVAILGAGRTHPRVTIYRWQIRHDPDAPVVAHLRSSCRLWRRGGAFSRCGQGRAGSHLITPVARRVCVMEEMFRFADALGPAKIVHIHVPGVGLKAIVVIDNVACGPAIGGVRMAPDVSVDECVRLARAMTLKNAAAALPHGGGKSVIFGDPHMPAVDKERSIRAFACAIRDLVDYIPGPDMGTDERCMAWVQDEIGRAVGLPPVLGGIPLDEIGATGFGLVTAIEAALPYCGLSLKGARVAVQGFGAVGRHAARFLGDKGSRTRCRRRHQRHAV